MLCGPIRQLPLNTLGSTTSNVQHFLCERARGMGRGGTICLSPDPREQITSLVRGRFVLLVQAPFGGAIGFHATAVVPAQAVTFGRGVALGA